MGNLVSGVTGIKSLVNVGSKAVDLVVLPITYHRKEGKAMRGVQKSSVAFFKTAAVEMVKIGARAARGAQSALRSADDYLTGTRTGGSTSSAQNLTDGLSQAMSILSRDLHSTREIMFAIQTGAVPSEVRRIKIHV
jgi:hypothetical protein